MKHLAIFKGDGGDRILNGTKTIESRFSKRRSPPFNQISSGDLVYIKPSGKEVIGQFKVKKVIFYDGLDLNDLSNLKAKYGKQLAVEKDYWEKKLGSKYGTIIFIGQSSRFLTAPIKIPKKDLRGWVILG